MARQVRAESEESKTTEKDDEREKERESCVFRSHSVNKTHNASDIASVEGSVGVQEQERCLAAAVGVGVLAILASQRE